MTVRPAPLWFLLLAGLATSALGCTDAGRCVRGEPGCAPTEQGVCSNGADDVDGVCGEENNHTRDGGGGSGGATGPVRPKWREPGPVPNVACGGDTVEDLCNEFCEALCQNQERFCSDSTCPADACGFA